MAADFPTMWAENRGFLAYPIRTRNCIFTQLHCRRRHKMPKIERLKRFGLMTARRDIANLKERHKMPKIERLKRFGARGRRDAISRI